MDAEIGVHWDRVGPRATVTPGPEGGPSPPVAARRSRPQYRGGVSRELLLRWRPCLPATAGRSEKRSRGEPRRVPALPL